MLRGDDQLSGHRHVIVGSFHALRGIEKDHHPAELSDHPAMVKDRSGEDHHGQEERKRPQQRQHPAEAAGQVAALPPVVSPCAQCGQERKEQAGPEWKIANEPDARHVLTLVNRCWRISSANISPIAPKRRSRQTSRPCRRVLSS